MSCNNDIMLHVTKGIFGIRVDNIDTFEINNVQIENIQNMGYYGSLVCGHYSNEEDGGHRNQRSPMQYGYTGTETHGVSIINSKGTVDNLSINKIISARGDSAGLRLFPGNELTLGTITISDIHAGAYAKSTDLLFTEDHKPNKIPRGCAIDYWTYYDETDDTLLENQVDYKESKITSSCVTSMTDCSSSSWLYSHELSNVAKECTIENGNLLNTADIVGGDTVYRTIAKANPTSSSAFLSFSSIVAKLEAQDSTNEGGIYLIPASSDMDEIDDDNKADNSTVIASTNIPFWIFIIVIGFGFIALAIVIYRKYKQSRKKRNEQLTNNVDMHTYRYSSIDNQNVSLISQQL